MNYRVIYKNEILYEATMDRTFTIPRVNDKISSNRGDCCIKVTEVVWSLNCDCVDIFLGKTKFKKKDK